jgi:hypothetical protein
VLFLTIDKHFFKPDTSSKLRVNSRTIGARIAKFPLFVLPSTSVIISEYSPISAMALFLLFSYFCIATPRKTLHFSVIPQSATFSPILATPVFKTAKPLEQSALPSDVIRNGGTLQRLRLFLQTKSETVFRLI